MANASLKRVLVGRPLASHKAEHQLLPKTLALPVFSSDALSSNAYATEEMMLVLVAAGAGALAFRIPIAIAIALVLVIVVTSYRQTVRAYPGGGGSYIVAHDNLGTVPGLVAAAALLMDYVLTVAVSVVAGFLAITSAVPSLVEHKVVLSIGLVVLVTLANLRGVKEAGVLFAVPTYGFVVIVYVLLGVGFFRCLGGCPEAATAHLPLEATAPLSLFLILKAFSSGATALTGVEAISNGVPAFRRPQAKNAATTLSMMAVMTVTMFLGITILTVLLDVRVNHEIAASRSVLSQIGETVFGRTFLYFVLQGLTAGILILAANTAYQDFPRLSAILARDRFMPSQFRNRGDRLVFSNGIIILALAASGLVYAFDADLTRLIQLYVVGVFTAFTLSQLGMVRRWLRLRGPGWRRSMIINAIGATATGVVLIIVTITKFSGGAWIVLAAMPIIIGFFVAVHRHYESIGRALRADTEPPTPDAKNTFVLLVRDLGPATAKALGYVRALRPERVIPLFVGDPDTFDEIAERWPGFAPRLGSLQRLDVDSGRPARVLRTHLRSLRENGSGFVTVIVPEELISRSFLRQLGRRWGFWLKVSLFFEVGIVVTDVPLLSEERSSMSTRPVEPTRHVVLVPISSVHAATARAVSYALSLEAAEIEAVFLSADRGEEQEVAEAWIEWRMDIPLSIVDAPFRDLGQPMLEEVRRLTAREGTVVTIVLPELVVSHWWEQLLHTQSALFFKRLLLFEPGVVVTSVPFHVSQVTETPPAVSVP
ncbi:MAG: APC family permease [Actinomycetota bacterium]|nr:APC family permease [Actinomycetota bacterium]